MEAMGSGGHNVITEHKRRELREAFDAGLSTTEAAKSTGLSRRTAHRYFSFFKGKPWGHRRRTPPKSAAKKERKPLVNPSRFYTSDFVPS